MSEDAAKPSGPDLAAGIALDDIADGAMLQGHANGEAVLLARRGNELVRRRRPLHALSRARSPRASWSATPSAAPGTMPASACARARRCGRPPSIRCRAGASSARATRSSCATSSRRRARSERLPKPSAPAGPPRSSSSAAAPPGFAAAEMLRREGYDRPVTLLSADDAPPCDRPNLSKDYPRGHGEGVMDPAEVAEVLREARHRPAPRTRASLRSTRATAASPLADGTARSTTARSCSPPAPIRCASICPAPMLPRVHYLRTLADSRAIVAAAATREDARW